MISTTPCTGEGALLGVFSVLLLLSTLAFPDIGMIHMYEYLLASLALVAFGSAPVILHTDIFQWIFKH